MLTVHQGSYFGFQMSAVFISYSGIIYSVLKFVSKQAVSSFLPVPWSSLSTEKKTKKN